MSMLKINKILLAIVMLLALGLAGCANDENTTTPAEAYLASHSQQEILAHFEQTYMFFCDFADSKEIPTYNLMTFVLFHERDSWYNDEDRLYYIPLTDVYEILDSYLLDYNLYPEEYVQNHGGEYDAENERFIFTAIGMGYGPATYAFYSAEVIDDDDIKVVLLLYSSDPEVSTVVEDVCITAKIVDGEPKFTGCTKSISDVPYESLIEYL